MIDRIRRYFAIREYKSTAQCRKLNYYIKRIRRDGPSSLTEEEWRNLDDLTKKERDFYSSLNTE